MRLKCWKKTHTVIWGHRSSHTTAQKQEVQASEVKYQGELNPNPFSKSLLPHSLISLLHPWWSTLSILNQEFEKMVQSNLHIILFLKLPLYSESSLHHQGPVRSEYKYTHSDVENFSVWSLSCKKAVRILHSHYIAFLWNIFSWCHAESIRGWSFVLT